MAGLILIALFAVTLVGAVTFAVTRWKSGRERRERLADERIAEIAGSLGRRYAGK
jgi:hypothetical protein